MTKYEPLPQEEPDEYALELDRLAAESYDYEEFADFDDGYELTVEKSARIHHGILLQQLAHLEDEEAKLHTARARVMHELRVAAEREYDQGANLSADTVRSRPPSVLSGVVAEIAAARRLPAGLVQQELAHAHTLLTDLPRLANAVHATGVSARHARVVADEATPVLQAHRNARAALDAAIATLPLTADETVIVTAAATLDAPVDPDLAAQGLACPDPVAAVTALDPIVQAAAPDARAVLEVLRDEAVVTAQALVEYEQTSVELAQTFTPPVLRGRCRKLAARLAGHDAAQRHRAARAKREVRIYDLPDGMSELVATLPTVHATAIYDRLTKQATALTRAQERAKQAAADAAAANDPNATTAAGDPGAAADAAVDAADANSRTPGNDDQASRDGGEPQWRTFEQLRADVLVDMLLTAEPSKVHASAREIDATVSIVVPILTLLGFDTEPATLNGATPIPMDDALRFTAHAPGWLRVLTDPITGVTRELDTYRPNKALRALIGARDLRCRFPGCRRPARDCEIDHIIDWANHGKTRDTNLEALCQRDHTLKHTTAWTVEDDPGHPGDLIWTSPAGATYTTTPEAIGPIFTPTDLARLRNPEKPPPPPPPF